MDLKSTWPWPKLLFAGLVAVVPAVLSYCKSSQEADHARIEADAGYKTLVESVRNLELVVAAQSNAIGLLTTRTNSSEPLPLPPHFPRLPDNTAAALRMQDKE